MTSADEDVAELIVPNVATCFPLAVSSLQAGVYSVLRALGVGPETPVACDPVFPYGALAAAHAGAQLKFPQLDSDCRVSENAWGELADGYTQVRVITSLFGGELDGFPQWTGQTILDAALCPFRASDFLRFASVVGVSFAANKPLDCGGGGLLLFREEALRDEVRAWSLFGVRDQSNPQVDQSVPGLDLRFSPHLVPVLRKKQRELVVGADDREASWRKIREKFDDGSWRELTAHGSFGWYRPWLADVRDALPEHATADGIRWRFLRIWDSAANLCSPALTHERNGVDQIVRRLNWCRPMP